MSQPNGLPISCPNCGQRFVTPVEQIIDIARDPSAKLRFLTGQVNLAQCPQCSFRFGIGTPLAYHDPDKELLLINVPMELNLKLDEQERLIGQLTRAITENLPAEKRKGYLLNPRRTFTLQGMTEAVLEADGVTKEMLAAQRERVQLIQKFLEAREDRLSALAAQNDEKLDDAFFQMITATAETALLNGRRDVAEQVLALRQRLLESSTYGKEILAVAERQRAAIERVGQDLTGLGDKITPDKLVDLAIAYAHDDEALQAFVGLIRPGLDYTFFQKLTERLEGTGKAKKQRRLEGLRERLLELTEIIDSQNQALVQQAVTLLQQIVGSPDIEKAARDALPRIDDVFMSVLEANIQEATRRKDSRTAIRLQQVYQVISQLFQENAPPEVRFINELLQVENELEARLMLLDRAKEFGPSLLDYMDALMADLTERGADQLVDQLADLRREAEKAINDET